MRKTLTYTLALTSLAAGSALAGDLDRTRQPMGALFETGRHFELGFSATSPDLSGTYSATSTATGDVGETFSLVSLAYKADLNAQMSFAVLVEQPYGALISYPSGSAALLYGGTKADATSLSATLLGRYKLGNGVSVHAGVRAQSLTAEVELVGAAYGGLSGYKTSFNRTWGAGFVAGAAYEIPEYALRLAVTYNSEVDHDIDVTESISANTGKMTVTTPQSVNIDFQTGIAEDTLLTASVRWANWDGFEIRPPTFAAATSGRSLVKFNHDLITYTVGVARRFTDRIAGKIEIGHQPGTDDVVSPLAPYDGFSFVSLGGSYKLTDQITMSGGVRYTMLGDARIDGGHARFENNSSLSAGLKFAIKF